MPTPHHISLEIPSHLAGLRLDQALTALFPEFSRSRLKEWITSGWVLLDGSQAPPKQRILGGEHLSLRPEHPEASATKPQDIPLEVIHADAEILIINKPPGLVVHPAAGHHDGTLLNALLHYAPELAALPRCGIVHRLDKDTSGLLMIARTLTAHKSLVEQLQGRSAHRQYLALVQGRMTAGGTIDLPIGRHPVDRKRFAVSQAGKRAVTHYRVEERLPHHSLLRVQLETGRTHQIRVHLSHLRYPLVGDPVYGRLRLPAGAPDAVQAMLRTFRRQALHAACLGLIHPATGAYLEWSAPLPADFSRLLDVLRHSA